MSDLAKQLFEGLKNVTEFAREAAPGLSNVGAEVKAELHRMGTLGASELAAALFRGDPFVMYGPSQRAGKVEQEHSVFGPQVNEHEHQSPEREIGRGR